MNDLDAFRILFCFAPADDEPDAPISEILKTVDQQPTAVSGEIAARLDRIRKEVRQREAIMARQGTVVATWRTRQGRKAGPYYRLAWREGGRQKSLYLGRSAELAQAVRQMLAELQRPLREDRAFRAARKQGWAALRAHKIVLARELARYGLYLHGWEVRGWRNTTLFDQWPLPPLPPQSQVPCPTVVAKAPDLSGAAVDTPIGADPTCCGAAVPAVQGRVCRQDRPFRRNGPDVDQHVRGADPRLPTNWRNRILLTNGRAARRRSLPGSPVQREPYRKLGSRAPPFRSISAALAAINSLEIRYTVVS
jgi:hypothetical protein